MIKEPLPINDSLVLEQDQDILVSLIDRFEGDIEEVFTCLFVINQLLPQKNSNLQEDRRKSYSEVLREFEAKRVRVGFIFDYFKGILQNEILGCLATEILPPTISNLSNYSEDHVKIAKTLSPGDVIISFNYDLLMPFALLNEKKLNQSSFQNSQFKEIIILPEKLNTEANSVKLFLPHGSFLWFADANNTNSVKVVFMESRNFIESDDPHHAGGNFILPFKWKEEIYNRIPIYREELGLALEYLGESDEVHLIGKQFSSGDTDLNEAIQKSCKGKKRKLVCVDPMSSCNIWMKFHQNLFNADRRKKRNSKFAGFREYVGSLSSSSHSISDPLC